jgi:hypothetical protein
MATSLFSALSIRPSATRTAAGITSRIKQASKTARIVVRHRIFTPCVIQTTTFMASAFYILASNAT